MATVTMDRTEDATAETKAEKIAADVKVGGVAADRLRSLVDRIERLHEERKALGSDISDIYSEAKSSGFDIKALKELIKIRAREESEQEELETLLDVYRRALGC